MSRVSNLSLDTAVMPTAETIKTIRIEAKLGAKFFLIITQSGTINFYDWTTDTFTSGHAPKNNLVVQMTSNFLQRSVTFPTGGGTGGTYVVKLITLEDTVTNRGLNVISKNIEKVSSDTTITLAPQANDTSKYASLPSTTLVGTGDDFVTKSFSFEINTNTTDTGSFGFRLFGGIKPLDYQDYIKDNIIAGNLIYHQTTENIVSNLEGSGNASERVTVADITDLAVGTQLYYHKTTTAPSSDTFITDIDFNNNILTFSQSVAFEDGQTMTFRSYGQRIADATGLHFELTNLTVTPDFATNIMGITKTVKADGSITEATDGSSTRISLNNTKGITGGSVVGVFGVDVDNTLDNNVVSVTPDATGVDGDGSVVMQQAQELTVGTKLFFSNTIDKITFTGLASITEFSSSNKEVNIDLDKLLIPGSAS